MADTVQYKHWKGEGMERGTIVIKKARNKVHIPEELEDAKSNHIYTPVTYENGATGNAYVAVPYEHQGYPKMLFHPNFHQEEPPNRNQFKETFEWESAMRSWSERFDRFQLAEDAKEEKRLQAKGWLDKPPAFEVAKSNPNSEEI